MVSLEFGWSHAGLFFELGREVGHAAVIQLEGNFREAELVIKKEFFDPLDFLSGNKLLNGDTLDLGKKTTQGTVLMIQFIS